MIRKRSFQIYLFFLIALLVSCKNKKRADVSNINLNIQIERFDQDFGKLVPGNFSQQIPALQKRYGSFYKDYVEGMLNAGNTADTSYYQNLRTILTNQDYKVLHQAVQQKFGDMGPYQKELTDAFKHIKYYFPDQQVPRIITFLSGFAVQVPVGDNYVGIGLDMFLGADSKFYPALRQSIPV